MPQLSRNNLSKCLLIVITTAVIFGLSGCNNLEQTIAEYEENRKTVTVVWSSPQERENGQLLRDDEISGYTIRFKEPKKRNFTYVSVENCYTNECTYQFENVFKPEEIDFEIATVDSTGLHSQYKKIVQ